MAAVLSVNVISTKANDTVIIFNCRLDHLLYQNLFGYACYTRGLFQIFAMIYHDLLWLEIYLSMLCFIFDALLKQSVRWMNSLKKQIFWDVLSRQNYSLSFTMVFFYSILMYYFIFIMIIIEKYPHQSLQSVSDIINQHYKCSQIPRRTKYRIWMMGFGVDFHIINVAP